MYNNESEFNHDLNTEDRASQYSSFDYSNYEYQPESSEKPEKKKKHSFFRKTGIVLTSAALAGTVFGGTFWGVNRLANAVTDDTASSYTAEASADAASGSEEKDDFLNIIGVFGEDDTEAAQPEAGNTLPDLAEDAEEAPSEAAEPAEPAAIGSTAEANASERAAITTTQASKDTELSVADIAENTMPAMVAITNTSVERVMSYFGGGMQDYESVSKGSGIIIGQNDEEILIATNAHVVSNAETLSVTFADEETVEGAIKGSDTANDLAVVAVKISDIKESTLNTIKVIEVGDSDEMRVGEQVVAIGNALGYGQSVSSGYVSAKDRVIETENGDSEGLLQTDAAINPGNSGGALLNMQGQLIGINSSKFADTEVEGMGFAIPVNYAIPILEDMMNKETKEKVASENAAYLGISCYAVTQEASQYYNIPLGVYVEQVSSGSAAEKAGILSGDIITAIGEDTVTTDEDLTNLLSYHAAGETSTITVKRSGRNGEYEEHVLTITFGSRS